MMEIKTGGLSGAQSNDRGDATQRLQAIPSILVGPPECFQELRGAEVTGRGIIQKEFAFTSATSSTPIVGTTIADPCMRFTVYDPANHKAAIAHVDHVTDLASICFVFNNFSSRLLEVRLFGGGEHSAALASRVLQEIEKVKGVNVLSSDFSANGSPLFGSCCIDARSGIILLNAHPSDFGTDIQKRVDRASLPMCLPLMKTFDGDWAS